MARVKPEDWKPRGVESLEPAAERVVRSKVNTLVTAGPGAGKTELLAQRACFLLETGECAAPHRILAISFKRDAASNLNGRVAKRCGDLGRRFDSMTLDAFGKSLVDRFRAAIPRDWRPKDGYEVLTSFPRPSEMREWLSGIAVPTDLTPPNFHTLTDSKVREIYERCQFGRAIPYDQNTSQLLRHYALAMWQERLVSPAGTPSLTFPMLNRLAAFLLRQNPKLIIALRATYSHVFMDEFQDTTDSQYDLVKAAFEKSAAVVTAVGDSKQRIMTWAGAMQDAFDRFAAEFEAAKEELVTNHRSSPELVKIQYVIAQAIESEVLPSEATRLQDGTSSCTILEFANPQNEATHVAKMIADGVKFEGLKPRDFCVLARQRTATMIQELLPALSDQQIRLRDESQLQDILEEPIAILILSLLRLATRRRDPEAWESLHEELNRLHGEDWNEVNDTSNKEAIRLLSWTKAAISSSTPPLAQLPMELVSQIGEAAIRGCYRQYRIGEYLHDVAAKLGEWLGADSAQSVPEAVNSLVGIDVVPAMTVHKSKGLEFHTVIFLGLEDSQLWNFADQTEEEIRGFFVAFSRAIHRVVFTFSDVRQGRRGVERQEKKAINDLYEILRSAGVETICCRQE